MATLSEYFEQHEEQAFIAKAIITVIAIIFVKEYLSGLLALLLFSSRSFSSSISA